MKTMDPAIAELEALREELKKTRSELCSRIEALEAKLGIGTEKPSAPAKAVKTYAPVKPTVSAETVAIIAAAVTSYLGKKVRVRSARLLHAQDSSPWSQQGRVFVQASHNLSR